MALGTNDMTITTGDVFIPEIWSKETQRATQSNLVLVKLVKHFDDEVADAGDLLHVPKISNINANAKVANTQVTLNAPTETDFQMSINRHFESSYLVENRLKAQAKYNILNEYSPKSGYAIAQRMDSDLAGLYSGLSQSVGNATTALNDTNLTRAIQYLDDADAPQTDRAFAHKPAVLAQLRRISKFSEWTGLGFGPTPAAGMGGLSNADGSAVRQIGKDGFVGYLYGLIACYMSTNLVEEAGTSDTIHNLLFHKEAFAIGVQIQPHIEFQYKQEYLGTLATTESLWGFGEYRDAFGIDVRTDDND